MAEIENIDEFDDQVAALEGSLQDAAQLSASFASELEKMAATMNDVNANVANLSSGMTSGLRKSLDGLVYGTMTAQESLQSLTQSMLDTAYDTAVSPVTSHFGSLLGQGMGSLMNAFLPFANGGAFTQGRVTPFANGGIVSAPTSFPMRGGMGLMGEAGPEAIMPLTRGADGKLGVRASGGSQPVNVVMNITTPDVQGFRRSQGQLAAQLGKAVGRGRRFS